MKKLPKIETLDVRTFDVEGYQRKLDRARVRRMAQDWCPEDAGVLTVNRRRGDSTIFVIDGQHRAEAARLAAVEHGDESLNYLRCEVLTDLSVEGEAHKFGRKNNTAKPLTAIERYRAAVWAGSEREVMVEKALAEFDLKVDTTPSPTVITAVAELLRLADAGQDVLEDTLWAIHEAFPNGDRDMWHGPLVGGVGLLFHHHENADETRVAERLAERSPSVWKRAIHDRSTLQGKGVGQGGRSRAMYTELLRSYNKGLRGNRRLVDAYDL